MSAELGETADRILQFIQNNPGCHLRGIKDMMQISQGTVQYHTDRLEKLGRITCTTSGLYKHYFPVGVFQNNEKEILQILSQETTRQILMYIVEQKSPTQTDIVNSVGISASSVNWHMKRLLEFKLVEEIKEGKYKRYQLHDRKVSSQYITALMRNYYPAIWEKWSDRLIEIFLSFSGSESK
ncbi:MAG: winged helix-turn-helix transcriptional regulator [Nitrososphaeraceae archaeon]|nr:winged helix-turn-helix transcriptional regulator [Nitrososphaeraceae archaeon]